jgi:hypothetical protein
MAWGIYPKTKKTFKVEPVLRITLMEKAADVLSQEKFRLKTDSEHMIHAIKKYPFWYLARGEWSILITCENSGKFTVEVESTGTFYDWNKNKKYIALFEKELQLT